MKISTNFFKYSLFNFNINLYFLSKILIIFLFSIIVNYTAKSQIFIDTVYNVNFGRGQNFGRSPEFFPNNIFGPPSTKATKYTPESSEEELCSLGIGGEIIVGAKDHIVINKPGVDFIIFENVFSNSANTKIFVEPAVVSVSKDGENFVDFPFDPETFVGLAGINWTNGGYDPFDITISGGDGFDLESINMDSIKYIKIRDTALIASTLDKKHLYYSPAATISGFDLDAVALVHVAPTNSSIISNEEKFINADVDVNIKINNDKIICHAKNPSNMLLVDILGNILLELKNKTIVVIDKNRLNAGSYFLLVNNNYCKKSYHIYNIR